MSGAFAVLLEVDEGDPHKLLKPTLRRVTFSPPSAFRPLSKVMAGRLKVSEGAKWYLGTRRKVRKKKRQPAKALVLAWERGVVKEGVFRLSKVTGESYDRLHGAVVSALESDDDVLLRSIVASASLGTVHRLDEGAIGRV